MPSSEWQAFVDHLANAERKDARRRKQEFAGRILYVVFFSALLCLGAGIFMEGMGWMK